MKLQFLRSAMDWLTSHWKVNLQVMHGNLQGRVAELNVALRHVGIQKSLKVSMDEQGIHMHLVSQGVESEAPIISLRVDAHRGQIDLHVDRSISRLMLEPNDQRHNGIYMANLTQSDAVVQASLITTAVLEPEERAALMTYLSAKDVRGVRL